MLKSALCRLSSLMFVLVLTTTTITAQGDDQQRRVVQRIRAGLGALEKKKVEVARKHLEAAHLAGLVFQ